MREGIGAASEKADDREVSLLKIKDDKSDNKQDPCAEEKIRLRREKLEKWRRGRELKDAQPSTSPPNVQTETSNSRNNVPAEFSPKTPAFKFGLSIKFQKTSNILSSRKLNEFMEEDSSGENSPKQDLKPGNKYSTSTDNSEKNSSLNLDSEITHFSHTKRFKNDSRIEDENLISRKLPLPDVEEDPLDKYMLDVNTEVERTAVIDDKKNENQVLENNFDSTSDALDRVSSSIFIDDIGEDNEQTDMANDIIEATRKRASKRKDLAPVDHSTIKYDTFRKDFYIEPPDLAGMTNEQVNMKRLKLDGIRIRGHKCPKPIEKWTQFGLSAGVAEVIKTIFKYMAPTPIQAQAIPAIMNGRDVIGIAKTGSGKTIAFLLPMFRHIKDQRPLDPQDGPIALIMTPTRELAVQINKECKHFIKIMGMCSVCCYGGSHIKEQIAELKRGAHILIGTPGRIIDLLCANNGKVTNLRRVTYLVIDEADRMFDMGFEPQVMRIVSNIRPDRQNVLFSATFPRKMEALARKILNKPLEITVGGRAVVTSDIEQIVEVRNDDTKFIRLLEILGNIFLNDSDSKVLIFVDRQEAADTLLSSILERGYPCQSLHGGKDQADRDSTISDFKCGNVNILIATSVASRGLDVKNLKVVINYDCPNHMEDYVHRVGRTGRAGMKGTSYTFITPHQERYTVDILKALNASNASVPEELQKLADQFLEKVKAGTANYYMSGFGGKGLEKLEYERDVVKTIQKKAHAAPYAEDEDEDDEITPLNSLSADSESKIKKLETYGSQFKSEPPQKPALEADISKKSVTVLSNLKSTSDGKQVQSTTPANVSKAREIISEINARLKDVAPSGTQSLASLDINIPQINFNPVSNEEKKQASDAAFSFEIEINDYPQKARWRVTNKEQISQITEISGAAITTRGTFFGPGKQPGPSERKLYLFIEGDNQLVIEKAKAEIKRILTEATIACIENEATGTRYNVI